MAVVQQISQDYWRVDLSSPHESEVRVEVGMSRATGMQLAAHETARIAALNPGRSDIRPESAGSAVLNIVGFAAARARGVQAEAKQMAETLIHSQWRTIAGRLARKIPKSIALIVARWSIEQLDTEQVKDIMGKLTNQGAEAIDWVLGVLESASLD